MLIKTLSILWWCGWCVLGTAERDLQAKAFQNLVNQALTDSGGKRQGLACNKNLQEARCRRWSNVFPLFPPNAKDPIEIPCGTCVWLDVSELDMRGGLHVRGKLVISENKRSTYKMVVSNVLVEGELEIVAKKPVGETPFVTLEFVDRGTPDTSCFGSKKGMVVSGGKVNCKYFFVQSTMRTISAL